MRGIHEINNFVAYITYKCSFCSLFSTKKYSSFENRTLYRQVWAGLPREFRLTLRCVVRNKNGICDCGGDEVLFSCLYVWVSLGYLIVFKKASIVK